MAFFGKIFPTVIFASALMVTQVHAGDTVAVEYDISLGGTRIMKANYAAQFDDQSYTTSFSAKSVGVSKLFSKIRLNLSSKGRVTKSGFTPVQYQYSRKKNDKTKERNLNFNSNGSLNTEGTDYEAPLLAALKKNIVDPLSMLLKVSSSDRPCVGKHRAFDGRDVFDISLSQVSAENGRLVCKLVYKPVAGADFDDGETEASMYSITLAPTKTAQNYVTVSLSGSSKGVPFSVDATSIAINGIALSN